MNKKPNLSQKAHNISAKMDTNSTIMMLMVAATLVVSISIVVTRLWWADVKFTGQVIKKKNVVNSTLGANVAAVPQLQTGYQDVLKNGPQASDVLAALPTTIDLPAFSSGLEAMAALAGAQLQTVSLSTATVAATASGTAPTPVTFQATAKGKYKNLQEFVANIEAAQRPMVINNASFSGSEPDVSLTLTLTSYYQPPTVISDQTETFSQ